MMNQFYWYVKNLLYNQIKKTNFLKHLKMESVIYGNYSKWNASYNQLASMAKMLQ